MMNKVDILGCAFARWGRRQTADYIADSIKQGKKFYLCTVNVAILMMMRQNPRLAEFINRSDIIVADGQPIVWTSKHINAPIPERVTGVDLITDLADMAVANNWGIYLLGATDDILAKTVDALLHDHPGLRISGYSNGYFDLQQAEERVNAINNSGAQILIVAMGVPRQEYFIQEQWDKLNSHFAIGVGGSFDVISGLRKRAPVFIQKTGLEWLYRLIQEPRRLFKRYLVTNCQFIYLLITQLLFKRRP